MSQTPPSPIAAGEARYSGHDLEPLHASISRDTAWLPGGGSRHSRRHHSQTGGRS